MELPRRPDEPAEPAYRLNPEALRFAVAPFSYEYVSSRAFGRWRILDSQDAAIGSAETCAGARTAVDHLNCLASNNCLRRT